MDRVYARSKKILPIITITTTTTTTTTSITTSYYYYYCYCHPEKHALSTGASREAPVDNACAVRQKHA